MKKHFTVFLLILTCTVLAVSFGAVPGRAEGFGRTAGIVTTSSGVLNVRKSNTTASSVIGTLPKGGYVTLIERTGSWWYVQYGENLYGYCSAAYLTEVSGSAAGTVETESGRLNVRSGPGTGYAIQNQLVKGAALVVLSESGGWCRILYNGTKIGYVSAAYVRTADSSGTGGAIRLSAADYKQYDSRWSYITLGTSGKSISRIGCLTCCLAITESYRTGSTITPDVMASRLTYTSGGSAYWPSAYTFYTGTDYLGATYRLLQEGKPVIFGGKTSSGGQHWVVVTGFTGGNTLSASNYTVNDPGSAQRTTLQQFLSSYPIFYKLAYYR